MAMAQKASTQWDLRYVYTPMPLDEKLFIFLMLAVLIVVAITLVRTLRLSRASRQSNLPSFAVYRDSLQKIASSLGQWLLVPLFAWEFLLPIIYTFSAKIFSPSETSMFLVRSINSVSSPPNSTFPLLFPSWRSYSDGTSLSAWNDSPDISRCVLPPTSAS